LHKEFAMRQPVRHTALLVAAVGSALAASAAHAAEYATVVSATPKSPTPARGQQTYGLVVVLGHDYASRFLGQ